MTYPCKQPTSSIGIRACTSVVNVVSQSGNGEYCISVALTSQPPTLATEPRSFDHHTAGRRLSQSSHFCEFASAVLRLVLHRLSSITYHLTLLEFVVCIIYIHPCNSLYLPCTNSGIFIISVVHKKSSPMNTSLRAG